VLTDRGTEYCGAREHHEYQLYLTIGDIDHAKTQARSPQSNGIWERFHKTPRQTFLDSLPSAKEKMLNQAVQTTVDVA
jgi:hypothetical protein